MSLAVKPACLMGSPMQRMHACCPAIACLLGMPCWVLLLYRSISYLMADVQYFVAIPPRLKTHLGKSQVPNPFNLDLSFFTATASASASPDVKSKGPADPAAGTLSSLRPCSHVAVRYLHDASATHAGCCRSSELCFSHSQHVFGAGPSSGPGPGPAPGQAAQPPEPSLAPEAAPAPQQDLLGLLQLFPGAQAAASQQRGQHEQQPLQTGAPALTPKPTPGPPPDQAPAPVPAQQPMHAPSEGSAPGPAAAPPHAQTPTPAPVPAPAPWELHAGGAHTPSLSQSHPPGPALVQPPLRTPMPAPAPAPARMQSPTLVPAPGVHAPNPAPVQALGLAAPVQAPGPTEGPTQPAAPSLQAPPELLPEPVTAGQATPVAVDSGLAGGLARPDALIVNNASTEKGQAASLGMLLAAAPVVPLYNSQPVSEASQAAPVPVPLGALAATPQSGPRAAAAQATLVAILLQVCVQRANDICLQCRMHMLVPMCANTSWEASATCSAYQAV